MQRFRKLLFLFIVCDGAIFNLQTLCRNLLQEGRTPLLLAAKNGHVDVARFLLSKNADAQAVNKVAFTKKKLYSFKYSAED